MIFYVCPIGKKAITRLYYLSMEPEESSDYFIPADDDHVAREKRKAAEMRQTQWWKNQLAKGICHYCGRRFHPSQLTMDHLVPIIRGGFTRKANLVTCCKECNSRKKYLLPMEWQEYLEHLKLESAKSTTPANPALSPNSPINPKPNKE